MTQAKQNTKKQNLKTGKRLQKKTRRNSQEARILLGLGIIILLGAALLALVYVQAHPKTAPTPFAATNLSTGPAQLIRDDSPTLGPANAKVTIVEFLDPECEACRAIFPIVKQLLKEYEGQVRLVVRYFPNHNNSVLAAAATEAAGEQGKYWEMQDLLFQNQPEWGEQQSPQTERFVGYAKSLGLDVQKFTAGLNNNAILQKIYRDRSESLSLQLEGTPTFFVNGQQPSGLSYAALKAAIEAALKQ